MSKFRAHRDKYKNVTTYDAQIAKGKLVAAGFLQDDGTVIEYEAIVEGDSIRLIKKVVKKDGGADEQKSN